MKRCVFAGTFDPPTLGHCHVIDCALTIFDEVVVGILINPQKTPTFSLEERKEMLSLCAKNDPRVKVITFGGTLVDLLDEYETPFYVRGVRNGTDFDYENADLYVSKRLKPDLCPVIFPCPQELAHISSTAVRSLLKFGKPTDGYLPEAVQEYIEKRKN